MQSLFPQRFERELCRFSRKERGLWLNSRGLFDPGQVCCWDGRPGRGKRLSAQPTVCIGPGALQPGTHGALKRHPTVRLGPACPSSLLATPVSGKLPRWWSGSQALMLALCCRRRFSTWLQRKTSSDSWALRTLPPSRETPGPISWPPLPLSGNGGCHLSRTLWVLWSLSVSRWNTHCCPKSSRLPSGSPVCVDQQSPTDTQFKVS